MFCLYFRKGPVLNLADAKKSDTSAFARFFHAALDSGIYIAPSQFEAGFLCTAHDSGTLEKCAASFSSILRAL
jgi:glutamate-1-semialdehyde 2,1-aminomutase